MDIQKLTDNLRRIDIEPSKKWQDNTLALLKLNTDLETNTNPKTIFNFLQYNFMGTIITVITAFLLAVGGTAYAADSANPGDLLYPVDKLMEQVQRGLTLDTQAKVQFELQLMKERVSELEAVQSRVANQGEETQNQEAVKAAIGEMEAQQIRLQEGLQAMNQFTTDNSEAYQAKEQFMFQFGVEVDQLLAKMEQIRTQLQSGVEEGNSDAAGQLFQFQHSFQTQMQEGLNDSELGTPVELKFQFENQLQNQGEETQIQDQNQNSNQAGESEQGETNSQKNAD